jgi:hypothetical protein|tara:strand:- start:291 stop:509 length:219 start_codon:yes stop_codon:yes gene_type:complete
MAVKIYKEQNSKKVRGCNVQAYLDTGWTLSPVNKIQLKPRRKVLSKAKLQVSEVKVVSKTDLLGSKDLTTEE